MGEGRWEGLEEGMIVWERIEEYWKEEKEKRRRGEMGRKRNRI